MQLLRDALDKYDNGLYAEAASIFDDITVNDENKFQVWLYGGNAYLNVGQIEKSKKMFINVIEENAGFVSQAKWYLSLCYVKNGEIEKAIPILEEIKETGRDKSEEAAEILSKL